MMDYLMTGMDNLSVYVSNASALGYCNIKLKDYNLPHILVIQAPIRLSCIVNTVA